MLLRRFQRFNDTTHSCITIVLCIGYLTINYGSFQINGDFKDILLVIRYIEKQKVIVSVTLIIYFIYEFDPIGLN